MAARGCADKGVVVRIIAGSARGRVLLGPKSTKAIRPTADRVRQTTFDVLGQECGALRVLDLFAGTGALALEALSRGAAHAVLVDSAPEAIELCRANARALGFLDRVEVLSGPVLGVLGHLARRASKFDLVFVDPPYAANAIQSTLEGVVRSAVLSPSAVIVAEHSKEEAVAEAIAGLNRLDQRRFGDTVVSIFRLTSPSA